MPDEFNDLSPRYSHRRMMQEKETYRSQLDAAMLQIGRMQYRIENEIPELHSALKPFADAVDGCFDPGDPKRPWEESARMAVNEEDFRRAYRALMKWSK